MKIEMQLFTAISSWATRSRNSEQLLTSRMRSCDEVSNSLAILARFLSPPDKPVMNASPISNRTTNYLAETARPKAIFLISTQRCPYFLFVWNLDTSSTQLLRVLRYFSSRRNDGGQKCDISSCWSKLINRTHQ